MERLRTLKTFQKFRTENKKNLKPIAIDVRFQSLSNGKKSHADQSGRTVPLYSSVFFLRNSLMASILFNGATFPYQ
jgi:hypothetical protein